MEKKKHKKQAINFGSICWEKHQTQFLKVFEMGTKIDKHIKLNQYGDGIQSITFVSVGVPKDDPIHKEKFKYSRRYRSLEIHKKLSFEQLDSLSQEAFMKSVGLLFLDTINLLKDKKIKSFDIDSFKEDVEDILYENGWLQVSEAA